MARTFLLSPTFFSKNASGELTVIGGGGTSYRAGNMISISNDVISVNTSAGISNIKLVSVMPQYPDTNVLYLVRESV
jgi:outer membrane receptor for ferrienterochelin and colicin